MATIQLDKDHKLKSDSRQWSLCKRGESNGEEIWTSMRHYTSLDSAIKGCYTYFVNSSDADGVLELMESQNNVLNKLSAALTPKYQLVESK